MVNGQLSQELQATFSCMPSINCKFLNKEEADLNNFDDIVQSIESYKPTHIINAAAYTQVEKAESEEELVNVINAKAVGIMADQAKKNNAFFFHFSTDYVFDGAKLSPYVETDAKAPLNAYGRSKSMGEDYIQQVDGDFFILRVSWMYGQYGKNFYKTILNLARTKEQIQVVSDQIGTPTWSHDIAQVMANLLEKKDLIDKKGIYHLAPTGEASWYDFSKKIVELYNCYNPKDRLILKEIVPVKTVEYPSLVQRPLNSRLNCEKIRKNFNIEIASWEICLAAAVKSRI